jgi:nucleotide-binding universal stress UspA family protein
MKTTQGTTLQSLRAVQGFLDQNAEKLAAIVKSGARQKLDEAVIELAGHVSMQSGSHLAAQGATQRHRSLRQALIRDHMAPISRVARADLPRTPEVEPLKMPRGRPTAERLAAAAYGMAKAAVPFSEVFTFAGLPSDFVDELNAATDAMLIAVNDRTKSRGLRGGATKGLSQKLAAGRRIVHVLDAFVKSALNDDPALLANWNVIKRVQRPAGRSQAILAPSTLAPSAGIPAAPMPIPAPTPTAAPDQLANSAE